MLQFPANLVHMLCDMNYFTAVHQTLSEDYLFLTERDINLSCETVYICYLNIKHVISVLNSTACYISNFVSFHAYYS